MKFLIVACFLAAVAARDEEIGEAERKSCAGEYLGGGNLTSRCEFVVKYLETEIIDFMVGDITFDWSVNCIKENLKKYNFLDFFLHTELKEKTENSTEILESQRVSIRNSVQSLCTRSNGFDENFNQLLEEMKLSPEKEKYQCLYKYSIEKKFISKSDFNFDTSAFRCDEFYPGFDEKFKETNEMEGTATTMLQKCCAEKLAVYHFMRGMEVYAAVATFELSFLEKITLKALYWDWFTGGDRILMECVRDVYKTI